MRILVSLAMFAAVVIALRYLGNVGLSWAVAFATLAAAIPFAPFFEFGGDDAPSDTDA